jgi:flagellar assembly protein FliH
MKVLRDIVLQEAPHTLARPRRVLPRPHEPLDATAADVALSRYDEGYAAGHAQARVDAERGLAAAREQLEVDSEQARRAAAAEGFEAGLRAGREKAEAELVQLRAQLQQEALDACAAKVQQLQQLAQALATARAKLLAEAEDDLIVLAHDVICRMLGQRAASVEGITDLVKLLLAQRERSGKVRVHLHPLDAEAVRDVQVPGWAWHADERVAVGGVVVRSAEGDLDARLDVQLAELRRTLLRVRRERRGLHAAEERS